MDTHLSLLDHLEALSKHQVTRHISGKKCPPLEDINHCTIPSFILHHPHGQLDFTADKRLPRRSQICLAEALREQFSSGRMSLVICHHEQGRPVKWYYVLISSRLGEPCDDPVNSLERCWVANGYLCGSQTDDWAVFAMH